MFSNIWEHRLAATGIQPLMEHSAGLFWVDPLLGVREVPI